MPTLTGANVLLRTRDQLFAALALIALDGVAARIVIAPPDLKPEHLPAVIERAGLDTMVADDPSLAVPGDALSKRCIPPRDRRGEVPASRKTEWVLFTSGTTGAPKMVAHSLDGLTGAIPSAASRRHRLGHFLRHSPLWRPADPAARAAGPGVTGAVGCR